MTHSALVDTGGFYALISENDFNHERALGVFRRANAERWALVTTNVVVFETFALLLNRTGEGRPKAIQFLDHLKASRTRRCLGSRARRQDLLTLRRDRLRRVRAARDR